MLLWNRLGWEAKTAPCLLSDVSEDLPTKTQHVSLNVLCAELNQKNGWDLKIHVDGASGGFVAPFLVRAGVDDTH